MEMFLVTISWIGVIIVLSAILLHLFSFVFIKNKDKNPYRTYCRKCEARYEKQESANRFGKIVAFWERQSLHSCNLCNFYFFFIK